jgi:hypothetical protein
MLIECTTLSFGLNGFAVAQPASMAFLQVTIDNIEYSPALKSVDLGATVTYTYSYASSLKKVFKSGVALTMQFQDGEELEAKTSNLSLEQGRTYLPVPGKGTTPTRR